MQVALPFYFGTQILPGHRGLRHTVDVRVPFVDPFHPGSVKGLLDPLDCPPLALLVCRAGHEPGQRLALEQAADHIEHLVGGELFPNRLELVQKHPQNPPLAGAARNEIEDPDFGPLAVAVNPAHPLLQPRRVPGDVVVDHQPAELQVDALAGRIGGDHVARTVRPPEGLHLTVPLPPVHAAVDLCRVAPVAKPFQAPHQVIHGVPVFAEDEPLLILPVGILQHLTELLELGFRAGGDQSARLPSQVFDLRRFPPQLLRADHGDRPEYSVLVGLVALGPAVCGHVVVRRRVVEVIMAVPLAQTALSLQ